ncbi:modulator of drug activity B [Neisseria meningitidis]|nr:modulator of drug activity B [Neisseria meningitidis]
MTGFEIAAFIGSNRSRSAVIPTKVGIWNVKSKETVLSDKFLHRTDWIPACAGMTGFKITVLSGMMENGGDCVKNAV